MSGLLKTAIGWWINADPNNWQQIGRRSKLVRRVWPGFRNA